MKKKIKKPSTDELAKIVVDSVVKLHWPPPGTPPAPTGVPPELPRKKRERVFRYGKMITY